MSEVNPAFQRPARTELPLLRVMSTVSLAQAIVALVELGVADELADASRDVADLAQATGATEEGLLRLLRAGVTARLFAEPIPRRFALTDGGYHLRTGVPGSLRDLVRLSSREEFTRVWLRLPQAVRSGRPAFEELFGRSLYAYLEENEELSTLFNAAMTASAATHVFLGAVDLSAARHVIDVGGGEGALLAAVLCHYPQLTGTLFDLPHVVASAESCLRNADVGDRCAVIGGSFFEEVPGGGDVYLMARVLQNWEDEEAVRILSNVRLVMGPSTRLLIIVHVPGTNDATPFIQAVDLCMLVMLGARLRSVEEYEALLDRAGLALTRIHRVPDAESVLEVQRAS